MIFGTIIRYNPPPPPPVVSATVSKYEFKLSKYVFKLSVADTSRNVGGGGGGGQNF